MLAGQRHVVQKGDALFALNACSAPISETNFIAGAMLPRLLRVRAHPTRLLVLFYLACDPVPLALPVPSLVSLGRPSRATTQDVFRAVRRQKAPGVNGVG